MIQNEQRQITVGRQNPRKNTENDKKNKNKKRLPLKSKSERKAKKQKGKWDKRVKIGHNRDTCFVV